jgi:tyrosine-protein phosphatase YwqE
VDDGMRTEKEALETLSYYETLGVRKVIFTPHIMEEFPENTSETLTRRFNGFRSAYAGKIELRLAGEYMLDTGFQKHLQKGNLLTISEQTILLETLCIGTPVGVDAILNNIRRKGYNVVMAHPERYSYLTMADYERLHNEGIKYQLNILSLCGVYGNMAQSKSRELLHKGWYDYLGTDIHNLSFFQCKLKRIKLKNNELCNFKSLIVRSNSLSS